MGMFRFLINALIAKMVQSETVNCNGDCQCDEDGPCALTCSGTKACYGSIDLICRPGYPCTVTCDSLSGKDTCLGANIHANGASNLIVDCLGTMSCQSATLDCDSAEQCDISCSADTDVCTSMNMDCGTSKCSLDCATAQSCTAINITTTTARAFECLTAMTACDAATIPDPFTATPTKTPSTIPSISPTKAPSNNPTTFTNNPTQSPSNNPSLTPTKPPTNNPSVSPTKYPTNIPSVSPTKSPSQYPSVSPTKTPSNNPSLSPTKAPSNNPSLSPTKAPSNNPSIPPTKAPTTNPSISPTKVPSIHPSIVPTNTPTLLPSMSPVIVLQSTNIMNSLQQRTKNNENNSNTVEIVVPIAAVLILVIVCIAVVCYKKRQKDDEDDLRDRKQTEDRVLAHTIPMTGTMEPKRDIEVTMSEMALTATNRGKQLVMIRDDDMANPDSQTVPTFLRAGSNDESAIMQKGMSARLCDATLLKSMKNRVFITEPEDTKSLIQDHVIRGNYEMSHTITAFDSRPASRRTTQEDIPLKDRVLKYRKTTDPDDTLLSSAQESRRITATMTLVEESYATRTEYDDDDSTEDEDEDEYDENGTRLDSDIYGVHIRPTNK